MNPATPEPQAFLQFWIIVAFIAMVVGQIISIVVSLANRKQQREVTFSFEPASKKEFDECALRCRSETLALRAELARDRESNQVHGSERSKTLFQQIEKVRVELMGKNEELRADMQRNFQDTERALGRIEGKLDGK